jgi:hypothetical protein
VSLAGDARFVLDCFVDGARRGHVEATRNARRRLEALLEVIAPGSGEAAPLAVTAADVEVWTRELVPVVALLAEDPGAGVEKLEGRGLRAETVAVALAAGALGRVLAESLGQPPGPFVEGFFAGSDAGPV